MLLGAYTWYIVHEAKESTTLTVSFHLYIYSIASFVIANIHISVQNKTKAKNKAPSHHIRHAHAGKIQSDTIQTPSKQHRQKTAITRCMRIKNVQLNLS